MFFFIHFGIMLLIITYLFFLFFCFFNKLNVVLFFIHLLKSIATFFSIPCFFSFTLELCYQLFFFHLTMYIILLFIIYFFSFSLLSSFTAFSLFCSRLFSYSVRSLVQLSIIIYPDWSYNAFYSSLISVHSISSSYFIFSFLRSLFKHI